MSKVITFPKLWLCLQWHPHRPQITKSQIVPSWEFAQVMVSQWGEHARCFSIQHTMTTEQLQPGIIALVYGRKYDVKVRLFKTKTHAQLAIPLIKGPDVSYISGVQF